MASRPPFYVTTAIDYPSAKPHLGHAYEKITADVLSRWQRTMGYDVFFSTGTDEHGMKIQRKAEEKGQTPQEYVDGMADCFKEMDRSLDVRYDRFVRTSDPDHFETCKIIFNRLKEKGFIKKDKYCGLYCTDCERYYTEKDLVGEEGKEKRCPTHKNKPIDKLEEESYFFEMSKFQKQLVDHIDSNPDWIYPANYREEVRRRLDEPLLDLCVSRTSFKWGIPCPEDEEHVMYVWIDALSNYLTSAGFAEGEKGRERFEALWKTATHIIGKDITWFHCVIWPCILMGADIPLPAQVFVHGFVKTAGGAKMSKSAGGTIDPVYYSTKYPVDAIRYCMLANITMGQDGEIGDKFLVERYNTELANKLGNLLQRGTLFADKNFDGKVPEKGELTDSDKQFIEDVNRDAQASIQANKAKRFEEGLKQAGSVVDHADKYMNDHKPWEKCKPDSSPEDRARAGSVIYHILDCVRVAAIIYNHVLSISSVESIYRLGYEVKIDKEGRRDFDFSHEDAVMGRLPPQQQLRASKEVLFKKLEIVEDPTPPLRFVREANVPQFPSAIIELRGVKLQKKTAALEKEKKELIKSGNWAKMDSPITKQYLEDFASVDGGEKVSTVNLIELATKKGLPTINILVDSYNYKSLQHGLVMGAYDRTGVKGAITLRNGRETDRFKPAGGDKEVKIGENELVYVDEEGDVVTRIFSKQAEWTKCDVHSTKDVAICIQGNSTISVEELREKAEDTAKFITQWTKGEYTILHCGSEVGAYGAPAEE